MTPAHSFGAVVCREVGPSRSIVCCVDHVRFDKLRSRRPSHLKHNHHMPSPLTQLTEEESLFYSTVRKFADETIAPLVRTMDDEQQFAPDLVTARTRMAQISIERGDRRSAIEHLKVAMRLDPDQPRLVKLMQKAERLEQPGRKLAS